MTANESYAVEGYLRDHLCGGVTHHTAAGPGFARRVFWQQVDALVDTLDDLVNEEVALG